ncbi:hypothetical protein SAMN05216436_11976 [bacterium A37T11]|nr:hypothetical protein SAMN05216436_11976 [bacterium A37T11]
MRVKPIRLILIPPWLLLAMLTLTNASRPLKTYQGTSDTTFSSKTIHEYNGATYQLKLAFDSVGKPAYYHSSVYTEVCTDSVCKPVFINLYWDLLGNYQRYDFPNGEILTKIDHQPFKEEDYQRLQDILSNENSLLKEFKVEDLIDSSTQRLSDSVDAVTGATNKTIKSEVIDGALYTCYTLWHIVHGRVTDTIRRVTDSLMNSTLLHDFLKGGNYHYQYYALGRVMGQNGWPEPEYESEVLGLLRGDNVFLARNILNQLSPDVFAGQKKQTWLWQTFMQANYALKLAILRKLDGMELQAPILQALKEQQKTYNEEISGLISKQLNKYKQN